MPEYPASCCPCDGRGSVPESNTGSGFKFGQYGIEAMNEIQGISNHDNTGTAYGRSYNPMHSIFMGTDIPWG